MTGVLSALSKVRTAQKQHTMKSKLKNILNVAWKVGLGLLGLVALCFGILVAWLWYDRNYGREEWADESLSGDVVVEAFNDGRVRVRNTRTGRPTTGRLLWVSGIPERSNITVFCDGNQKRGFLDITDGSIVIQAQYSRAWHFSEGLAAVVDDNGKVGFVDRTNRLVIPCEIPYEKGFDYVFKDGYCKLARWSKDKEEYEYSVIDKTGAPILPWGCSYVSDPNPEGYRIVREGDGERLYDREFRPVFPEVFEDVAFSPEGEGVYLTRNHVKQLVDYTGKVLEPFVIDGTRPLKYVVRYNDDDADEYELVQDIAVYLVNSWEGLLNLRTGKAITPAGYWVIGMASRDLVEARLGYGTESVLLDKRGRKVDTRPVQR